MVPLSPLRPPRPNPLCGQKFSFRRTSSPTEDKSVAICPTSSRLCCSFAENTYNGTMVGGSHSPCPSTCTQQACFLSCGYSVSSQRTVFVENTRKEHVKGRIKPKSVHLKNLLFLVLLTCLYLCTAFLKNILRTQRIFSHFGSMRINNIPGVRVGRVVWTFQKRLFSQLKSPIIILFATKSVIKPPKLLKWSSEGQTSCCCRQNYQYLTIYTIAQTL